MLLGREVHGPAPCGIEKHGRQVLDAVAGSVHGDREGTDVLLTTAFLAQLRVSRPFEAESEELEATIRLGPPRVTEGFFGGSLNPPRVLLNPANTVIEGQLRKLLPGSLD